MDNIWQGNPQPLPLPGPQDVEVTVEGGGGEPAVHADGSIEIPTEDGGVLIDLNPERDAKDTDFDANLALSMPDGELSIVAELLLQGIGADDQSRAEWLATLERAIDLLGLKLEEPRGDVGASSAPLEGMATVRHPVLLEAVLRAQATSCAELLPASGPVKIEDVGAATPVSEELSEAMEKDFNDYLTNRAPEYYPDTRRALFWSALSGSAFKKVYSCPLRQRPVSETLTGKDVIVSAGATDLINANRVTHVIMMRQSIMKRMQVAEVYRDVDLSPPNAQPNRVEEKQAQVEGILLRHDRPEDQPYTVYECYCELDLKEFAPKQFKDKAIPLPYRVTLEKDSRAILEIRRNWNEDDEQCLARRCLVKYPYVEGMGIYGIGLLHILGNPTSALTAAWRLMLDNGMFANFPGGIVDKAASRQLTNEFRVPPGGMVQLDFGGRNASQVYGPLPYRDLGPVWVQFITHMEEVVARLGGAAEMPVGEGKQDAPVGTTLALIEQATKIESEVHKGLHAAQAQEFQLLKERFKEDPGALWRHCKKSKTLQMALVYAPAAQAMVLQEDASEQRRHDLFIAALDSVELVPVADPNSPSHTHRILKWQGLKQIAMKNPSIDQNEVDKIGVRTLGFDPGPLFKPPEAMSPPPDPKMISAQAQVMGAQAKLIDLQNKAKNADTDRQIEQQKLQVQMRVAELQVERERIIHQNDARKAQQELVADHVNQHLDRQADLQKHAMTMAQGGQVAAADDQHRHLDRFIESERQHGDRLVDLHKHHTGLEVDLHNSHLDREAQHKLAQTRPKPGNGKS